MTFETQSLPGVVRGVSDFEASLIVRPAQPEDAVVMNELCIERRPDTAPDYPEYNAAWIMGSRQHGAEKVSGYINGARTNPAQYFSHVAVLSEVVAGYALGQAPSDQPYTWWRGIIVGKEYEGAGVGRSLETARRVWAQTVGRPVRVHIVVGNNRSMDFFQQQGFELVDIEEATPERPLRFNVMELGLTALNAS